MAEGQIHDCVRDTERETVSVWKKALRLYAITSPLPVSPKKSAGHAWFPLTHAHIHVWIQTHSHTQCPIHPGVNIHNPKSFSHHFNSGDGGYQTLSTQCIVSMGVHYYANNVLSSIYAIKWGKFRALYNSPWYFTFPSSFIHSLPSSFLPRGQLPPHIHFRWRMANSF